MTNKQVTSLECLSSYAKGAIVELPSFADGQPFVARLKRPSMLVLVKNGKIPNELLGTAEQLFMGGSSPKKGVEEDKLEAMLEILDIMAEACFVEPTFKQIKDAGVELTDDQYMFLFAYSQQGVKALNSFRKDGEGVDAHIHE